MKKRIAASVDIKLWDKFTEKCKKDGKLIAPTLEEAIKLFLKK